MAKSKSASSPLAMMRATENRRANEAMGRLGMSKRWYPEDELAQVVEQADIERAAAAKLVADAAERLIRAAEFDARARELREAGDVALRAPKARAS